MTTLLLASASPARATLLRAAGVHPRIQPADIDEDAVLARAGAGANALGGVEAVRLLARAKAEQVAATAADTDLVLGCDSLLELDGRVLGKPGTVEVARERWQAMRGRTGVLHTGHWLIRSGFSAAGSTRAEAASSAEVAAPSIGASASGADAPVPSTSASASTADTPAPSAGASASHAGGPEGDDDGPAGTAGAVSSTSVTFADITDAELEAYLATREPLAVAGAFTIDGLGGAFVRRIEGDHHTVVGLSLYTLRALLVQVGYSWTDLWS